MKNRLYYEWITYDLLNISQAGRLDEFLEKAALPAYNQLGINPVGVFKGMLGPDSASVFILLPHPTIESVVSTRQRLMDSKSFVEAGESFLLAPFKDPAYFRMESSLSIAFTEMPDIELPENNLKRESRFFELRTYESHSLKAHLKKIEMFNQGGEVEVFRKTGMQPVFFGETLIGPRMPNLVYMVTFDSFTQRDEAWSKFVQSPGWNQLKNDPQYADTVSNISDNILSPMAYSQI